MTNPEAPSKRGPKFKQTDQELMEIALNVKAKLKHQMLTPSVLERETGIGRNTWTRRIKHFMDELNQPITREIGLSENDVILFPNIESIFELYGNNKSKLILELHRIEILLQDIYSERNKYKEQAEKYIQIKKQLDESHAMINELRDKLRHYKSEYEKILTSSIDPELRKNLGINNNLLDFNSQKTKFTSLEFQTLFSTETRNSDQEKTATEKISYLSETFPDLFNV